MWRSARPRGGSTGSIGVILGTVGPSSDEVRLQLERVLGSELFAGAERARRFLRYVTERTLAGESDQLKEFVIGVDVFDRDDQYDPRIDSIVRVEAGRLRGKLDRYYGAATDEDSVVIRMRRGSYVPEFEHRVPLAAQPARSRRIAAAAAGMLLVVAVVAGVAGLRRSPGPTAPLVSIVVLPFEHYSPEAADQLLAARLTDGVTSELARIRGLSVVSRTSAVQLTTQGRTLREIARTVDADMVVEGSLLVDGSRLELDVRLVDTAVDRKGWGQKFAGEISNLRALQRQAAAAIASAAAGRMRVRP
jgi:TolB-like protein